MTDPSYAGQIVALTYPLIGNYGINTRRCGITREGAGRRVRRAGTRGCVLELARQRIAGFVSQGQNGVLGITGVDTRALTRRLRHEGVMMGALSTEGTRATT